MFSIRHPQPVVDPRPVAELSVTVALPALPLPAQRAAGLDAAARRTAPAITRAEATPT
ncbi:hypothetical protein [Roseateles sp.]|uniref:hypothetical protein n=1 Tax=Roseateles sp. TaxID=1971397 RepID=UPI0035A0A5CF